MSTAGKVLTVLILLVMVTWLIMLSAVTQLNVNWQQKIEKQDKDLASTQAEVDKAAKAIVDLTEQARFEQDAKDRDLREIRGRIAAVERRQSATIESLTRLKVQVTDYLTAVEQAEKNLVTRKAEKVKVTEDLARKRDEITRAQTVNADLRGQLAKLQDEYKRLLADNASRVQKILKDAPATKEVVKPRLSPSS